MEIETFLLERNQSLYENDVEINLTESGVHASSLRALLRPDEIEMLLDLPLGYGHTEGTPGSRAAVAAWHPGATAANVLLTAGASEANLVALLASVHAGDELVVITPNFMQIPGMARALGATVTEVPLVEAAGWSLDRDALERAVTPRTRLIAVCNPNNPTGALLSDADREALVQAAERCGAWLLCDEIYRGAELGGRDETPTLWGRSDRVLISGGLAKSFANPGLRLGWIIGPEAFVYECMRRQDYTTIGTGPLSQFVAERLLQPERRREVFGRGRATLDANLAQVRNWIASRQGQLSLVEPGAGGMTFVSYGFSLDSETFSRLLRETQGVFVVAGAWFGLEGRVRIGIGGDAAVLAEGLRRIGVFLDGLNDRRAA